MTPAGRPTGTPTGAASTVVTLVLALVAALSACGSDAPVAAPSDEPTTATASGSAVDPDEVDGDVPAAGLPPADFEELAEIFDPVYAPMGLRLARGALIDRSDGGYEPSPLGTHLALYVEPIDDEAYDLERYVAGLVAVTEASAPLVFERWPDLESYDICQEPAQATDPRPDPRPATQVEMTRAEATAIDWDRVTLTDLLVASDAGDVTRVLVSDAVRSHRTFAAAREAADRVRADRT